MADNYGIKVANPDKSIFSAEPRDFVFNSKWAAVKIVMEPPNQVYRTAEVPATGDVHITIPHLLGFVPLCLVFTELVPGSGRWYYGTALGNAADYIAGVSVQPISSGTYVDSDNLHINFKNDTAGNLTIKYYYYIFADSGD